MSISNIAVLIVGLIHFLIATIEIFFWKKPAVYSRLDRLKLNQEVANQVAPIVANAGLYNAFLATGLVWSVSSGGDSSALKFFFLGCVAVAGIFGAATLNWKPLLLQTLPALVAALLVKLAITP